MRIYIPYHLICVLMSNAYKPAILKYVFDDLNISNLGHIKYQLSKQRIKHLKIS